MLSRLAGSVFHVGSAVERADVVARMLDVYVVRPDAGVTGEDAQVGSALRAVVGAAAGGRVRERAATVEALALDRHEPASIAHAVGVARDHARRAREVVSTELWDCLDVTRSRMPRKVAVDRAHEFLSWVRERSALAVGVVEGDVSRDEVWEFFTLGRSLLRCGLTARLLASPLVDASSSASWTTALRACGAGEAFRRGREHHGVEAQDAAHFLLHEGHSPRSLAFLAARADDCLSDVAPACTDDEVRAFRSARGELERVDIGVPAEVRAVADRLASTVAAVIAAFDTRVFAAAAPAR
ncbi:alpha-E domain-containing protein [Curtobacterium caseinilyticum]|uniref:Alpha-E domain-containing protein n=1 Tax=Curtobacterium caseinilyticum TaxID=3055137 RepID=A0ABT7TR52_9MICO|nr:alpha-E domain-containing protein [Curtobacterium caseinilyticum]MDM7891329.1 alpha-E domain-containing protein [Curtobacterium caseinilyticum]